MNTEESTVVVFTESYPFVKVSERVYFEPEIKELSRLFDRVIIMPRNIRDSSTEMPEVKNVEIRRDWIDHPYFKHKWLKIRHLAGALRKGKPWKENNFKLSLTYGMTALALASFLEKWMKKNGLRPDKTVFYTFWFDYSTTAIAILKERYSLNSKLVSRVHSYYETSDIGSRWKKFTATKLDALFPVSNYSNRLFMSLIPKFETRKSEIFPLGCIETDVSEYQPAPDTIRFITICRLDKEKWLDKMLEFMDALATARSEKILWTIVGGGDDAQRFKKSVEANKNGNLTIDLRGEKCNAAVHEIYREGYEWSLLLSPGEARPVALCESLMHGIPVVANESGGIPEIIDDESGLLLPYHPEKEEFVRGIAPYLDSFYRYGCLRAGARKKWEDECNALVLRRKFAERLSALK